MQYPNRIRTSSKKSGKSCCRECRRREVGAAYGFSGQSYWLRRWLAFSWSVVSIGFIVERQHRPSGISAQAQARVLFNTLSDHLDRSQILLAEVANASSGPDALKMTQERARDLADENRLLRLASNRNGESSRGALLEDLERILLSVANAPSNFTEDDLSALQKRIDDEGLLFKVRITDDDLRREERKL